ncbi:hypothetical protein BaOVIS_022540 [Babesia ovis]|uniref:Guanylate-binding protein N-terminal domain-containing protein n=1 Tax=Babesia ovis TaxID=5869 RepID=A0A9W5TBC6_BABOV|nr:hypothetical protein BaOVIS_022540 [Babesia ovis]
MAMLRFSSPSVRCDPQASAIITISWLLLLLTAITGSTAESVVEESTLRFTAYGEPCQGNTCLFDHEPVEKDVQNFCITNAAGTGRPVQLIRPAENHLGLEIVEEGLELIRSLPKPIAVVAAIGSIKTGKSSLLNVLNEHNLCGEGDQLTGFKTSNDICPTTQGIWIWSEPIKIDCQSLKGYLKTKQGSTGIFDHLVARVTSLIDKALTATVVEKDKLDISKCEHGTVNVVLLDVEGFNATDGFQKFDEALFTITAAMSTELIYLTHKLIDASDIMELQHMMQESNAVLVNMYKSLSNAPKVVMRQDKEATEYSDVELTPKIGGEPSDDKEPESGKSVNQDSEGEMLGDMLLELQKNTTLTLAVHGFNMQLHKSSLDYLNSVINQKRFDMEYDDQKSFIDYLEQTRQSLIDVFIDENGSTEKAAEDLVGEIITKLTSRYKYGIPHLFGSVDVLLTSAPSANHGSNRKSELFRGYLQHILSYKKRLFKRSILQPKKRVSPVSNVMTHMTGEDMVHVLHYLVDLLNQKMKQSSIDGVVDLRLTKANLIKHDLVELYSGELMNFIHRTPIPLEQELDLFNKRTEGRYQHLMAMYAQYDLSPAVYDGMNDDFGKRLGGVRKHLAQELHNITLDYCRSKVNKVKSLIRARVEQFDLPVLPSVIDEFERDKQSLMDIYSAIVDENQIEYSSSDACRTIALDVEEFVDAQIRELHRANDNEITMMFQEASKRAIGYFIADADRNDVDKYTVSYDTYEKSLQSWVKGTNEIFYNEVGEFKDVERFSNPALEFLRQQLTMLIKESRDHWEDVCKESLQQMTQKFKMTFDRRLQKLVPIRPAPKQIMKMAVEYLRFAGLNDMSRMYCGTSKTAQGVKQAFGHIVDEMSKRVLEENDEAIYKQFYREFHLLYEEAIERVNHVYHFYQLENHLYWYAEKYVFPHAKVFEQMFRPDRALDEMRKHMDIEIINGIPDRNVQQRLMAIFQGSNAKAIKLLRSSAKHLKNDIVQQWIRERLYPDVRDLLMIRIPRLSTVFAMIGIFICSLSLSRVRNARLIYFLYFSNAVAVVYVLGLRRVLLVIGMAARWFARIIDRVSDFVGTTCSYVIVAVLLVMVLLRMYVIRRKEKAKTRRRTKYFLFKRDG